MTQDLKDDRAAQVIENNGGKPVQVIAVTGGKGGVGKTSISVNLAIALATLKNRVMLFDADLGLANVDIMLGLHVKKTLADVLKGECDLNDIVIEGPAGVKIVPAASGVHAMATLSQAEHAGLIHAFSEIGQNIDYLIVDTAAGISDSVVSFTRAANELITVVCDEPTSITDAYALMKVLSKDYEVNRFHVIANMVRSAPDGRKLFAKLSRVTDAYLDVTLDYVGEIPFDEMVHKAIKKQKAVMDLYPNTAASMAYKHIAAKIKSWPISTNVSGHMQFFVERLIQASQSLQGV